MLTGGAQGRGSFWPRPRDGLRKCAFHIAAWPHSPNPSPISSSKLHTSLPSPKTTTKQQAARWFEDALADAQAGDAKAAALLAQMYAQGYGCERDAAAAARWAERARARGYRMSGVYCAL